MGDMSQGGPLLYLEIGKLHFCNMSCATSALALAISSKYPAALQKREPARAQKGGLAS